MNQLDIFQILNEPLPKITKIKLGTFFSGIGSPEKSLKRIGVDYELMFFSEIDKYAIQSYCAIHDEDISKNKGDITKIKGKDLPYCDMWFGGFPCQDISLAGKQKGFTKDNNTRSSLGWEMIRLLDEVEQKPKYVIFENVANIMSEPMRPTLNLFKEDLEKRGYTIYNELLNAKDYGIPQNRERYFLIAILGEYYYKFPLKQELKLRLKDMLEDEVDEKYYIKTDMLFEFNDDSIENVDRIGGLFDKNDNKHQAGSIYNINGLSPTFDTMQGGYRQPCIAIPEATQKGYAEATEGDGVYINRPHQKRGVVQKQMIQTLKTSGEDIGVVVKNKGKEIVKTTEISNTLMARDYKGFGNQEMTAILSNLRIRKLTPLECYRLMGFDDEDYEKASQVCSNSQLYKQAGNSIVVNVLEAIFKELFKIGADYER